VSAPVSSLEASVSVLEADAPGVPEVPGRDSDPFCPQAHSETAIINIKNSVKYFLIGTSLKI
jgi:hypothetical protein